MSYIAPNGSDSSECLNWNGEWFKRNSWSYPLVIGYVYKFFSVNVNKKADLRSKNSNFKGLQKGSPVSVVSAIG